MSAKSKDSFLDSMARPTGPSQVRVKPGQILRQKITSSVTTMLAAIERQPPTESSIRTSGNERNSEQNNASSYQDHPTIAEHSEPVQFKRRLVLRQHVPVRTRTLVQLQKSYRLAQTYVNESLTDHVEFEKKEKALCGTGLSLLLDEDYVLLRCALRERFESKLKTKLQIKNLVTPEIRELALLEQFWKEQRSPNAAERMLLHTISGQSQHYINGWFAAKKKAQRATDALERKMISCSNNKTAHSIARRNPGQIGLGSKNPLPRN